MQIDIDIGISSCARPKLLSRCLESFFSTVKKSQRIRLRTFIIEDYVEDEKRRLAGKKWIIDNDHYFDDIFFLEKNAGFGWHFQEVVKNCNAKYLFRLEDDHYFLKPIDLELLVHLLETLENAISINLKRDGHQFDWFDKQKFVSDVPLVRTKLFSDSIGIFDVLKLRNLLETAGYDNQLHERAVLTPASVQLKYAKYCLGYKKREKQFGPDYIHLGVNQRQGSYES